MTAWPSCSAASPPTRPAPTWRPNSGRRPARCTNSPSSGSAWTAPRRAAEGDAIDAVCVAEGREKARPSPPLAGRGVPGIVRPPSRDRSVGVAADDLAAVDGAQAPPDGLADRILQELDAAVGHQGIDAA